MNPLNYIYNNTKAKDGAIRQHVIDAYLNTGEAVVVSDLEKAFKVNSAIIYKALLVDGGSMFDRFDDMVEPSKKLLRMFAASISPKHGLTGPFTTI